MIRRWGQGSITRKASWGRCGLWKAPESFGLNVQGMGRATVAKAATLTASAGAIGYGGPQTV